MPDKKVGFLKKYYPWVILLLLSISFVRPLIENINYPLLTTYDTWNFLSFATQIKNNHGIVPNWDNLGFYPQGRPFLYPPLIPFLLANSSLILSIDIFHIIKFLTIFLYLGVTILFCWLVSNFKNKYLTILSLIIFLSINQVFVMTINSLSQIAEIIIYIAVITFIYKKRYYWATFAYAAAFWTHFATPFFFGFGLFLYGIHKRDELKQVMKTVFLGFLLGVPWLTKYLTYSNWIHPNVAMPEHTTFLGWFMAAGFDGFPFFVLIVFILACFLLSKEILKDVLNNRLSCLLIFTSIGMIPSFYYPERAITYIAPAISIIGAYVILRISLKKYEKAMLILFFPIATVFLYRPSTALFTSFSIFFVALFLVKSKIKNKRKICLVALLLVLLFISPDSQNPSVPFLSWARPKLVDMNLPIERYEACMFISNLDKDAIVDTQDGRDMGACNYLGLKTSGAVVREFSLDGEERHPENADYFIEFNKEDNPLKIAGSLSYYNFSISNKSILELNYRYNVNNGKHLIVGIIGNSTLSPRQERIWSKGKTRVRHKLLDKKEKKSVIYLYDIPTRTASMFYYNLSIDFKKARPTYKIINLDYLDNNEEINFKEVNGIILGLSLSNDVSTSVHIKDAKINDLALSQNTSDWNSIIGNIRIENKESYIAISSK